jgi:hypothetical protein
MPDDSHLDRHYFIDDQVYNCPFCNRRHVAYRVVGELAFDWTPSKHCWAYTVRCESCKRTSMHLTFRRIEIQWATGVRIGLFKITKELLSGSSMDDLFFYSVPTSFFVLDDRIPKILRELMSEAEGCLKSNFLTGASACARKIVYELAVMEKADAENYDERIKSLKAKHPEVDSEFFDTLLTIQQATSSKVHEGAYAKWSADHVRVILAALAEVLQELYVVPAVREEKRKAILALKQEVVPPDKAG